MHHYKFFALVAMLLCGSSFASDAYFVCDTAKGTIKLDENKGVLRYTLSKDRKTEFNYESKGSDYSGS